ncbi:MAG: methionyl-tRNA formyltransferase [Anaerovoracaceae bacterium]
MKDQLKIVYMGTPDFAVPPLNMLVSEGYDVRLAVTQPDKARDRGKKVQATPVKAAALAAGIPVAQPEKIKNNQDFIENLKEIDPDIIIVAAYGKILPPELLGIPRLGCVNIHASLLPRFRGAAPINRSIMAGDEKTGVTLMYMEEGLDTGDMIAKAETETAKKTADQLHDELSLMGAALLAEYLPRIASGDIEPKKQDDALACYAPMISKEEGRIDFGLSAFAIECFVRGMPAKPGAYADYCGVSMKIRGSEVTDRTSDAAPGTVIGVDKDRFYVACGQGVLAVTHIQMPGKKTMAVSDYLKGNRIEEGTVLK